MQKDREGERGEKGDAEKHTRKKSTYERER
jgi:hypothetical protein